MAFFMKEANQHWKSVAETLRAAGHNPTLCLEAARAGKQGIHHDADLAKAFNDALMDAKTVADMERLEKRKTRNANAR